MSARPFVPKRGLYLGRCCPCPGPAHPQLRPNQSVRKQGGGFGRVQKCRCRCHREGVKS